MVEPVQFVQTLEQVIELGGIIHSGAILSRKGISPQLKQDRNWHSLVRFSVQEFLMSMSTITTSGWKCE